MRRIICFIVALSFMASNVCAWAENFEIHFLDVGQGNAAIVICDDEVMLIDGGPSKASSLIYSYLRNNLGTDYISRIISTHPHADHVGGIAGALNAASAGTIYTPVTEWDSKAFNSMLKYAGEAEIIIPECGMVFELGSAYVELLCPDHEVYNTNDMSIVTRIVYGETAFLFMGDAEYMEEYELIDSGYDLSADVLMVGHHGSYTSTTYQLLWAVNPAYAVISVGANNSYGHPAPATVEKLENSGTQIFRTDINSHIICRSDGTNIYFG